LSGAIVWSVAKLASITFLSLAFSNWIDYLGFTTEGKLAAVLITPSLGVPHWSVIYIINTAPSTRFLALLPGRKTTSARGVSHAQFLLFLFCFTLFLLASFYQKYKK
jgi:energy-coupling factor transporter transmembrane protein EcfT